MLAYSAYTWLLGNAPISTVTTYAYVNPVIALALGAAILSEEITATVLVGAAGDRGRGGDGRAGGGGGRYSGQDASPVVAPRMTFRLSSAHLRRVGEMSIPAGR